MLIFKNIRAAKALAALVLGVIPGLSMASVQVYISPTGSDSADGLTSSTPVQTFAAALLVLRAQRAGNTSIPATINVASGRYELASPIMLLSSDSNTTIVGPVGNTAIITGGKAVTGWSKFVSPAIKKRLSAAALRAVYSTLVPTGNLGAFSRRGGPEPGTAFQNQPAELVMNGVPMALPRFPATGWMRTTGVAGDGVTATFGSSRRVATSNDTWVQGFWSTEWWQTWEPATSAPAANKIQVGGLANGSPLGPVTVGARIAIVNSLEDLNSPGQYYMDRPNNRVYFYPPNTLSGALTEVSQLDGYLLDAYQTANVTLKNLTFQASRGQGVQLYACTNTGLDSCIVRSTQLEGVCIEAGANNFVVHSNIHDTGSCGILSIEGNIATLTSGGDRFVDNTISNPGRLENTDRPGIWVRGVGATVSQNTIKNCASEAIFIDGCNHQITLNDISNTGQAMNDVGAIYTGQNVLNRGNVISQNIIHDIPAVIIPQTGTPLTVGVYLDDFSSGFTVQNNIFYNVSTGVLIGGGRNNTVAGNAFTQVSTPVWIDARGTNWAAGFYSNGGQFQQEIAAMSAPQLALFKSTYPDFLDMVTTANPSLPANNVVSNPYFPSLGIGVLYLDSSITQGLLSVTNPLYNGNTIFVNPALSNYNLVPGAQVSTPLPTTAGSTGSVQSIVP